MTEQTMLDYQKRVEEAKVKKEEEKRNGLKQEIQQNINFSMEEKQKAEEVKR